MTNINYGCRGFNTTFTNRFDCVKKTQEVLSLEGDVVTCFNDDTYMWATYPLLETNPIYNEIKNNIGIREVFITISSAPVETSIDEYKVEYAIQICSMGILFEAI